MCGVRSLLAAAAAAATATAAALRTHRRREICLQQPQVLAGPILYSIGSMQSEHSVGCSDTHRLSQGNDQCCRGRAYSRRKLSIQG